MKFLIVKIPIYSFAFPQTRTIFILENLYKLYSDLTRTTTLKKVEVNNDRQFNACILETNAVLLIEK